MITLDDVVKLIRREMRGKAPVDMTLDESTSLSEIGLSSLQVAEVIFSLEEQHGVEFNSMQAADAATVGDLVALGNKALAAKG